MSDYTDETARMFASIAWVMVGLTSASAVTVSLLV